MFNFIDRVMKKNLLGWLAMVTMLVGTGCSTDEVVNDYSPENAIQFGTYVGRDAQGRGSIINEAALKAEGNGFGVFAYYTGQSDWSSETHKPDFMYNQYVKYETSAWGYSPLKYWPNNEGDKLTFFAYAPFRETDGTFSENITSIPANNAAGYPMIGFTVSETVKNQKDLLYADVDADSKKLMDLTKQTINGDVEFHFKHALSKIAFYAETMIDAVNTDGTGTADGATITDKSLDASTTVTIKSIDLTGTFYPSGKLNLRNGSWTKDAAQSITYSLVTGNFKESGKVNNGRTLLNEDGSYIMIIPRDEDGAEESITIKVVYEVKTEDTSLDGGNSTIENTHTATFDFDKFEQGKSYAFALHLGLTSVKVTASVANWGEEAYTSVNVPLND